MTEKESHNTNNPGETDDHSLIRAFHRGEKAAFDIIVLRYKDRVFNLCFRFLGNYHDAEDTTQDVFVRAFDSLGSFRFESTFFTWLYRIAVNTCKNRVKSLGYRYRKMGSEVEITDGAIEHQSGHADSLSKTDPYTDLEKKETMKTLQSAIHSLPSDQRSVVILRDIQGMSYEEIMHITGFKLGTLKSKLSRARSALKEKLGDII